MSQCKELLAASNIIVMPDEKHVCRSSSSCSSSSGSMGCDNQRNHLELEYLMCSGVKIGAFTRTGTADPDSLQREMTAEDEAELREGLQHYMPSANGRLLKHAVCMFTNTSDGHFIIDTHPRHPQVGRTSACTCTIPGDTCFCYQAMLWCTTCDAEHKACTYYTVKVVLCSACSGHGFKVRNTAICFCLKVSSGWMNSPSLLHACLC